jgi:putative SOS response-associated peptidase YedK
MPVADAPDDDSVRQSYNFAPGYHGLVYRADAPDRGGIVDGADTDIDGHEPVAPTADARAAAGTRYKLQAMKWGLVPFWTKRNPDYGSMLKTINCRDDSLIEDRGMWTSMKKKKRCIIVAQGFYEWLKKNNGKDKLPHLTKRPDGQLLCFAGLWDCVQYQGQPSFSSSYHAHVPTRACHRANVSGLSPGATFARPCVCAH